MWRVWRIMGKDGETYRSVCVRTHVCVHVCLPSCICVKDSVLNQRKELACLGFLSHFWGF